MFVYGADFFLLRPGIVLAAIGFMLTLPLTFGPITLGPITLSLYWQLLGLTMATLGTQCFYLGVLAQIFYDYSGETTRRWFARFPYTRTVAIGWLLVACGLALAGVFLAYYVRHDFHLFTEPPTARVGVTGLLLAITGFATFTFTLLLHATSVAVWRRPDR